MKEKVVDIALIVTLIIVAFGITWTLLTLNRSETRPVNRQPVTESNQPGTTEIQPLPLERNTPAGGEVPRVAPEEESQSSANTQQRSTVAREESNQPQVAEPEPVPSGSVQLERIGFSFVTGGAGACGVILEPWRHVAVSRELLAAYGCGAEITITLAEETDGREQVEAMIADTMNPSFSRTANIYVGEDEPALEYGLTSGILRP
ncbi:MAG: hypothetical protein WD273_00890 [Trueperaceae bacterium]